MKTRTATPDAYRLFHAGTLALADVEQNGMRIDVRYLRKTIADTERKIAELERTLRADKVWRMWQDVFRSRANLGSRDQLGHLLFSMMGYTTDSRTPTGKIKVDKNVLEKVDLPFVKMYLEVMGLRKIKDTYLLGISRETVDGIMRPSFNLNTTATFRSSCNDPNSQNLPSRDPGDAEIVRRCVIPRKGHRIVERDFKQLEVMIAACYHHDPVMMTYLRDPDKDMHRDMAMELYLIDDKDQVSKQARYSAKNGFVFPAFYGSVWFQCAPALWENIDKLKLATVDGVPLRKHLRKQGIRELGDCNPKEQPRAGTFEAHVKKVEERFWKERFKVYDAWKCSWWQQYQEEGSFQTLTGFLVRWGKGGVLGRNDAINYPVQGSAFHCLLETLIVVNRWLKKNRMKTKITGQIHDSLIADVHSDEFDDYMAKVDDTVVNHLPNKWPWIIVPLAVEAEVAPVGASWWEKSEWHCTDGKWGPKA